MALDQLTQEQLKQVNAALYQQLYGTQDVPDGAVPDDDTLLADTQEKYKQFRKDHGLVDPAFKPESEIDLSNEGRKRWEQNPFSDMKNNISTADPALFHAFLANNGAEFEFDGVIDPDELKVAERIIQLQKLDMPPEEISNLLQKEAAEAAAIIAQKEAEKIESDAAEHAEAIKEELAALDVKDAKDAANKSEALHNSQLPLSIEAALNAFMTTEYKAPEGYNIEAKNFTVEAMPINMDGIINGPEEEAMHGMLRQHMDLLEEKYIGKEIEIGGETILIDNQWELRDLMYDEKTPYDANAPHPRGADYTRELSEFGQEVIATMINEKDFSLRIESGLKSGEVEQIKEAQGLLQLAGNDHVIIGDQSPENMLNTLEAAQEYYILKGHSDMSLDMDYPAIKEFYDTVEPSIQGQLDASSQLRMMAAMKKSIEKLEGQLDVKPTPTIEEKIQGIQEKFAEAYTDISAEDMQYATTYHKTANAPEIDAAEVNAQDFLDEIDADLRGDLEAPMQLRTFAMQKHGIENLKAKMAEPGADAEELQQGIERLQGQITKGYENLSMEDREHMLSYMQMKEIEEASKPAHPTTKPSLGDVQNTIKSGDIELKDTFESSAVPSSNASSGAKVEQALPAGPDNKMPATTHDGTTLAP